MLSRLQGPLNVVLWAAIVLTPWCYGGTVETCRYALAAGLLLAGAWVCAHTRALVPAAAPCAALLAWGLGQVAISPARVHTLESLTALAGFLAVFLFTAQQGREETLARGYTAAVVFAVAAQAAFGVVQAALLPGTIYGRGSGDVASPYGSYANHNHFAGLVEMGAVFALALAVGHAKRARGVDPWSIGFGGLSLALAGAHLASRSRGGLLALIAGTVAFLLLWRLLASRRATGRVEWGAAALILVALLSFGWLSVPATTRAHLVTAFQGPTDASGSYRLSIGAATLRLWWEHPILGCGLANYADSVTRFKRTDGRVRASHAESDALELAAEGGLVGLALLGWLGAAVLSGLRDRLREGRDPRRKLMAVGALAAVIAVLAHSFFDFNLRIPANALLFSVLLGLAAAPRTEPATTPAALRWLLVSLFLVFGAAAAWRALGAFELQTARRTATPAARLGRLSEVLSRHPYLAEAWRDRAHLRWELARGGREVETYRRQGALEDMEQLLRLRPKLSYAWADLGWLRQLKGDTDGARAAFDQAAALDPADVAIGLARVGFFVSTGRQEEGRQELQRIRSYNPDWPAAAAEAAGAELGVLQVK